MPYQVVGKKHTRVTYDDKGKRTVEEFMVGQEVEPTENELKSFPDRFRFFPHAMKKEEQVEPDNVMPGQGQYERQNQNPLVPEAVEHQTIGEEVTHPDAKDDDEDKPRGRGRLSNK